MTVGWGQERKKGGDLNVSSFSLGPSLLTPGFSIEFTEVLQLSSRGSPGLSSTTAAVRMAAVVGVPIALKVNE